MAKSPNVSSPAVPSRAGRSSITVTVACKIPQGVVLQLCKKTEFVEDTQSGPRARVRFDKTGERVVIAGCGYPVGSPPKGYPERPPMADGYALTHNVDADFWDEWLRQNERSPLVTSKMLFAHPTVDAARGEAQDHKGSRSGLEPMDPEGGDPRVPRPAMPGVSALKTADERRSA